jgi:hypothetical protein
MPKMIALCFLLFAQLHSALSCTGLHGIPSVPIGGLPPIGGGGHDYHPPTHGGGSHGKKCIHWNGKVQVSSVSNETRNAHELEIGDRVLAYDAERGFHLSPVIAVLNRDLVNVRDFVRIYTAGGREVALTTEHGIFSGQCGRGESWTEKRADAVNLGDCVKTSDGEEDEIEKVEVFADAGTVQPITETGSIVVGDVVVSCYDYAEPHVQMKTKPHLDYEPYRMLYAFGERLYNGFQKSEFAVGVLERLVNGLGLEKMYV